MTSGAEVLIERRNKKTSSKYRGATVTRLNQPIERPTLPALVKGFLGRCPSCEEGQLFGRYLKVEDHCQKCGEAFHHHEADDAPAYFTILIVGHILVPLAIIALRKWDLSAGIVLAGLISAITVSCLALLPRIKGALIAFQWAKLMHGFDYREGAETTA